MCRFSGYSVVFVAKTQAQKLEVASSVSFPLDSAGDNWENLFLGIFGGIKKFGVIKFGIAKGDRDFFATPSKCPGNSKQEAGPEMLQNN